MSEKVNYLRPLVSVIIPAYNRSDYIDQTVQSVLEQSYPNVELIVVDDGSTDGTYEKILGYGDRLTLLSHNNHENRGQSAAINLGLGKAKGQYIAILDSDDYWAVNKLEIQVAFLEKYVDIGLVYTNGYGVDENGKVIYEIYDSSHSEKNDPNLILLDCYILLPLSSLVKKEVFDRAGRFNVSYRAAQDHDMLIRIAEITEFSYLPECLFYYRRHGASISSNNQKLRWKNGYRILEQAQARYPYRSATIRKRKAVLSYRLGICSFSDRQLFSGLRHMLVAFLFDPIRAMKVLIGMEKRD